MRSASRLLNPAQPVSTSMDSPEGETIRVACPPSVSMAYTSRFLAAAELWPRPEKNTQGAACAWRKCYHAARAVVAGTHALSDSVCNNRCLFAASAALRWEPATFTAAGAARASPRPVRRPRAEYRRGRGSGDPLASIDGRTASILCYIPGVGWIMSIIVLASDRFRRDRAVRFHGFQALYLFVAWLIEQQVVGPMLREAECGHSTAFCRRCCCLRRSS